MSHIPFTLAAYLLNGFSVLVDKYLLSSNTTNPLIYIFFISCFSLVALVFVPFTHIPTLFVFSLASVSTLLWTLGAYFMYKALKIGNASRVIPIIGTLIPLVLLIQSLFAQSIPSHDAWAVLMLVAGIFFLTVLDWKGNFGKHEVVFEVMSSIFFAISYLLLHMAYQHDHFLTVLVWSRFILVPVGIALILIPQSRGIILGTKKQKPFTFFSKTGMLFLGGQGAAGISELLLTYSVSLANPALVNSLQGTQYVFLYIASIFLSKKMPHVFSEERSFRSFFLKTIGIVCIAIGLYVLAFGIRFI